MQRAAFAVLGLIATILPTALPPAAQTVSKLPRIAYVWIGDEGSDRGTALPGFRQGLRDQGYQEGANIVIEYRYARGSSERLREIMSEVVSTNVDLIVATSAVVGEAVKHATTTIPVIAVTGDPLASGLVFSLARPGGNITGFSFVVTDFGGKWVELLTELRPGATRLAMLWNPWNAASQGLAEATRRAAESNGLSLVLNAVIRPADLPRAFAEILEQAPDFLIVDTDALLLSKSRSIVEFAAEHRVPAIYGLRQFVDDGGLISYGANPFDVWHGVAGYVTKILQGAKPADLPVQQPTKFELVVNLKTAKVLGVVVPPLILARADEVIE